MICTEAHSCQKPEYDAWHVVCLYEVLSSSVTIKVYFVMSTMLMLWFRVLTVSPWGPFSIHPGAFHQITWSSSGDEGFFFFFQSILGTFINAGLKFHSWMLMFENQFGFFLKVVIFLFFTYWFYVSNLFLAEMGLRSSDTWLNKPAQNKTSFHLSHKWNDMFPSCFQI